MFGGLRSLDVWIEHWMFSGLRSLDVWWTEIIGCLD